MLRGAQAIRGGDVDGDGHDDLIMLFDSQVALGEFEVTGVAYFGPLPRGEADALDLPRRTLGGGGALRAVGDVNGDGRDDVEAQLGTTKFSDGERVIFSGGRAAPAGGFDLLGTGRPEVAGAGDANGDGRDDLLAGRRVVFGKAGSAPLDPLTPGASLKVTDALPLAAAPAGDVNADGLADVLVQESDSTTFVGFGRRSGGTLSGFRVTHAGDFYAGGLGSAGDVNGDGRDDVIVSGGAVVFGKSTTTSVSVAALGALGFTAQPSELEVEWPYAAWGVPAAVGDVTGGGRADLAYGSHLLSGPPTGPAGSECTVTGTAGADVLTGTAGADVVCGLGGNDTLRGLGGDDVLSGGPGLDRLAGDGGNDVVLGGPGDDRLDGGPADDRLDAGDGNDRAQGGTGADNVLGGAGFDELLGTTSATDRSVDQLVGGPDGDTLSSSGPGTLDGSSGNDQLYGGPNSTLLGGTGDDYLTGGEGAQTIRGGDGDDTLAGGGGSDVLEGGLGADWLSSAGDGRVDADRCGAGMDVVCADAIDGVLEDCESRSIQAAGLREAAPAPNKTGRPLARPRPRPRAGGPQRSRRLNAASPAATTSPR